MIRCSLIFIIAYHGEQGMKIIFLDAGTLDYGDMDFTTLSGIGEFTAYHSTSPGDTVHRSGDADIIITNKVVLDDYTMAQCPNLRLIAVSATGVNNIDLKAAAERNIAVANVPGYSTSSVDQFTMMFILALAGNLIDYNNAARDGRWSASPFYTLGTWPTSEVADKTLGILGMGAIGSEVARLADAFRMHILALGRDGVVYDTGYERLPLRELPHRCDFISIHMPLTEENRHCIDRDFFSAMKQSAFLINMARGPIVDPDALVWALREGEIRGAALDVMEKEPPDRGDPLLSAPNLILAPHIAWAPKESRLRLLGEIVENIRAFLRGERRNTVA